MKTPKKKEIETYFENAKTVECIGDKSICNISEFPYLSKGNNNFEEGSFVFSKIENIGLGAENGNYFIAWSKEKGYAKILSYKNEYKITKEQILELSKSFTVMCVNERLNKWYPECFKKELIVGRWYKSGYGAIVFCESFSSNNDIQGYGFNSRKEYVQSTNWFEIDNWQEATPKEVEEALIKEWEKLGGNHGVKFQEIYDKENNGLFDKSGKVGSFYYFKDNKLFTCGHGKWCVFKDGKFAKILPTKKKMTISEIEEKLGFEIEIV